MIVTGLDSGLNIAAMQQDRLYAVGLESTGFYDYSTGKHVTGCLSNINDPDPHRAYLAGEHEAWVNPLTDPLILVKERKEFQKLYATHPSREAIQKYIVRLAKNIEARTVEATRARNKQYLDW